MQMMFLGNPYISRSLFECFSNSNRQYEFEINSAHKIASLVIAFTLGIADFTAQRRFN